MDKYLLITTLASNCLNVIAHDTEADRWLWTFLHDKKWHVSDEKPVVAGRDAYGRVHVDVKVKEVFSVSDTESLLAAQRQNGFNSWRDPLIANPSKSSVVTRHKNAQAS